jgi:hypothetical protein
MVYILFNKDEIFGVYNTEQLVRHNSYVFLYKMKRQGKISREEYFAIKKKIFDTPIYPVEELRRMMKIVGIFIDAHSYEENGLVALRNIMVHVDKRFDELDGFMEKDSRVTVTIPGINAMDNKMMTAGIQDRWKLLDPANFERIMKELGKILVLKIQTLELKYEGRVQFGVVSDTQASETSYQVWPADKENWNLPKGSRIPGDEMAICFEYQVPGVFGIVVDPMFGYTDL